MSLSVKRTETDRLARQLAAAAGAAVILAVIAALRELLNRLHKIGESRTEERTARIRQIAHDAGTHWVEPHRSLNHGDVLYDGAGLPR